VIVVLADPIVQVRPVSFPQTSWHWPFVPLLVQAVPVIVASVSALSVAVLQLLPSFQEYWQPSAEELPSVIVAMEQTIPVIVSSLTTAISLEATVEPHITLQVPPSPQLI
jgi:hypothetical protein